MASYSADKIVFTKNSDTYTVDVSKDIVGLSVGGTSDAPTLQYTTKDSDGGSINLPVFPDTKNTAGSSAMTNTMLYIIGATERNSDGVLTYTSMNCYIGADNQIYSNGQPVLTSHQDISGKVDKVTGKGLSTNDFTNAYKNMLDNLEVEVLLEPSQPINIPAAGGAVTKYLEGLTANHELVRWNFSNSAENFPPVSLTWTTNEGYFTITNTSSFDTNETIQPVFGAIVRKAATDN